MGKVILCVGKTAKTPYLMKATGTKIHTMEELCYYIYHNVETISEDLFQMDLIEFIRTELGLTERADYLMELVKKKVGIKDLVVCFLCSADYFDKNEINHLLAEIDVLFRLNTAQRKKRHADFCMRHNQWSEAMREYRMILNSKEFTELTSEEYGDILHNIGLLEAKSGAFVVAANKFREAYERNHKEESLKQYLYALKLGKQEEVLEREIKLYAGTRELIIELDQKFFLTEERSEYTALHAKVDRLDKLREEGKIKEYYSLADELLSLLKDKYRKNSI